MADNIYNTPDIILAEFMYHMTNAMVIAPLCGIDKTSDFTQKAQGYAVGDTISIKTMGEYKTTEFTAGNTVDPQAIRSSLRPMQIEKHFDQTIKFGAREESLDISDLSSEFIQPAAYDMADTVDRYLGTKLLESAGLYASDNLMGSAADVAQIRKAATLQQLDPNGRFAILDPDLEATALGLAAFNQAQTRGNDGLVALRDGQLGKIMGIDWNASVNFPTPSTAHSAGNGVAVTANTGDKNLIGDKILVIAGSATGSVVVGDRLKIAGVHRPLKVATAVADLSVATEIALVDPITEVIPDGAGVTVIGAGEDLIYQGAVFDKRTLGVAFPMLEKPAGAESAVISYGGITLRAVKQYTAGNKESIMSIDMLCGSTLLDTRRGTLLASYS